MRVAAIFARGELNSVDDQKIIYQVRVEELFKIQRQGYFHIFCLAGDRQG